MQWRSAVRAWGASRRYLSRPIGVLAIAALAASAAGCSSMPSAARLSLASAASSSATVAFESIDGPPPEVFRKLVADLNDEAGARKIVVVSRSGAATYRIRGYVSALVERDKTSFAWVWDVYDIDQRRTLRISGEEPAAAGKRRDAWLAADEQVLRRMARNGMEQFAGFLNSSEPAPAPGLIVPEPALVTVASARDDSPEAAGIFRIFGAQDQPASPAPETADVPAPPPAPKAKKQPATATAALTRSTDGRSPAR